MKIQLIKGSFSRQESLELISKLMEVKMKFHESKIKNDQHEEDIKMRENRIRELQRELDKVKFFMSDTNKKWELHSEIAIETH
jgi:cob(I)alamin adenosyltransferase